jgi:hypothetical protein
MSCCCCWTEIWAPWPLDTTQRYRFLQLLCSRHVHEVCSLCHAAVGRKYGRRGHSTRHSGIASFSFCAPGMYTKHVPILFLDSCSFFFKQVPSLHSLLLSSDACKGLLSNTYTSSVAEGATNLRCAGQFKSEL